MTQWSWATVTPSTLEQLVSVLNQRMALLQSALGHITNTTTFADGDATPSVAGIRVAQTNNSAAASDAWAAGALAANSWASGAWAETGSPTQITAFDDGTAGQILLLGFGDANTTLVHSTNLQLIGNANFTGAVGDTKLFGTFDGTIWSETPQPNVWA